MLCQNAEEFLIQANTQKRPRFDEDDSGVVFQHVEVCVDSELMATVFLNG